MTGQSPVAALPPESSPDMMKLLLQVVREFLLDCDHDIEGCDADELMHIEGAMCAARTIRTRFVNLATGVPCDERGELRGGK